MKAESLSVSQQRGMVIHARQKLGVSERRACAVTGIARSSMRYQGMPRDDDALRLELIRLAKQYGHLFCAIASLLERGMVTA